MMQQRKRSRDEFEAQDDSGAKEVLGAELGGSLEARSRESAQQGSNSKTNGAEADESEWQTVERSRKRKKLPTKDRGNYPSITHSSHARLQSWVKVTDLQALILYVLADGNSPQWCSVAHRGNFRKVVVLMIPGLEAGMFDGSLPLLKTQSDTIAFDTDAAVATAGEHSSVDKDQGHTTSAGVSRPQPKWSPDAFYPKKLDQSKLPEQLQQFSEIFGHMWPIRTPGDDKYSRMHSPLASILLTSVQKPKEQKGNNGKGPAAPAVANDWKSKRALVTEFIASRDELLLEGYVLHPAHFSDDPGAAQVYQTTRTTNKTSTEDGWADVPNIVALQDSTVPGADIGEGSVTAGRRVLAIDCEMCITSPEDISPPVFSLTRMSVTDWDGNVVLDELVKPADPVTNYVTPYSGITPEMLENVTTTLQQAQQKLLEQITPETILVGHSLNSDLNALKITHPFIIDTALLYPHPRGPPLKSSLKWLAQKYLSRTIQAGHGSTGHNSIEDARASLDLVKQKCEKGKAWGTSEASNESIFLRLGRAVRPKRDKVLPDGDDEYRVGAVVDWGDPKRGFGGAAKVAIGCKTDGEVVSGVRCAVEGDDDASVVPVGGVDFVWARFRELEAYRKWWRSSKTGDLDAMRETTQADNEAQTLSEVVGKVAKEVQEIWESLPPCTAFIVYSGSGDPRKLSEMQGLHKQFKTEYATKKWDQLSVKWTDTEEQELRRACEEARRGIGFIAVK